MFTLLDHRLFVGSPDVREPVLSHLKFVFGACLARMVRGRGILLLILGCIRGPLGCCLMQKRQPYNEIGEESLGLRAVEADQGNSIREIGGPQGNVEKGKRRLRQSVDGAASKGFS